MCLLNIVIADVRFAIHCRDLPILIEPPNAPYASFLTDATAGDAGFFTIDVNLETGSLPAIEDLTEVFEGRGSWSMFKKGDEYYLVLNPSLGDGPECIARFDRRFETAIIYCGKMDIVEVEGKEMIRNPFSYPLDQLLLMYALAGREGILIHAAGVDMQGKGYIFPGRSGSGKSTLARQFADAARCDVLSDDRVVVRKIGNDFYVFGTPWPGEAGDALNKGVPLAGIMFLAHAEHNLVLELGGPESGRRLLPVVSVPWYDREATAKVLSFCDELITNIPAYELSFRPGRDVAGFLAEFAHRRERRCG